MLALVAPWLPQHEKDAALYALVYGFGTQRETQVRGVTAGGSRGSASGSPLDPIGEATRMMAVNVMLVGA